MDPTIFFKGILLGFSIAAPVGPIGVLCIRRTLASGRASGLVSGLGAATADAFYGSIAGFGLTLVSGFLVSQQAWLRLLGGAFLVYLGIRTFASQPAKTAMVSGGDSLASDYASTLLLTLTNPMTIISFAAIFAGLGVVTGSGNYLAAAALVAGVFLGSAAWWFVLSAGASLFRTRFTPAGLVWVNRISGMVILGFGVAALLSFVAY